MQESKKVVEEHIQNFLLITKKKNWRYLTQDSILREMLVDLKMMSGEYTCHYTTMPLEKARNERCQDSANEHQNEQRRSSQYHLASFSHFHCPKIQDQVESKQL